MNTSLLQDKVVCEFLKTHMTLFFETNNNSAKQVYVWEAFKAYIRRVMIQRSATIKKFDKQKIDQLETELKTLEREYWSNPNNISLVNLMKTKYELNTLFSKKAEYSLYRLKQRWYELGEKAGKLLASGWNQK
jgi:hypothetical protein